MSKPIVEPGRSIPMSIAFDNQTTMRELQFALSKAIGNTIPTDAVVMALEVIDTPAITAWKFILKRCEVR